MAYDRRTVVVLLIGLLAALALALAAATIANPSASAEGGMIGFEGDLSGLFEVHDVEPTESSLPDILQPILRAALATILLGAAVIGLFVLEVRDLLRVVGITAAALVVLGGLLTIVSLLSGSDEDVGIGGSGPGLEGGVGLPAGTGEGGVSPLLLGAVGVVAMLALIVLFALSSEDADPDGVDESEETEPRVLEAIGAAAGRAADRMARESVTPSNAVYRAWVEMTAALDVTNRESTTPGEFATEAIKAGMDPEDVSELTRLFEDVRYGDEPVWDERIEQAQASLRRIEASNAGEQQ